MYRAAVAPPKPPPMTTARPLLGGVVAQAEMPMAEVAAAAPAS